MSQFPQNLVPDPSFEYDTIGSPPKPSNTYWGGYDANTPTSHNVVAGGVFGGQCLQVVTSGTVEFEGNGVKCGAPEVGIPHNGSIYLKGNAGGEKVQIVLQALTPTSKVSGVASKTLTLTTEWERFELNIAPMKVESESPNHIYLAARTAGGPFAYTYFIDGVMIVPNATSAPVYFDGDSIGYRWTGTPGNSISTSDSEPPIISASGELFYQRVLPIMVDDEQYEWFGRYFCDAAMSMLQGLDQIVLGTATHDTWCVIADPSVCPDEWLPWEAAIYGVPLSPGISSTAQRETIEELPPQKRGGLEAMYRAAEKTLKPGFTITIVERAAGKAYKIVAATSPEQTATEEAATLAALLTQKPGGIALTYTSSSTPRWEVATKEWSTVAGTVAWNSITTGQV